LRLGAQVARADRPFDAAGCDGDWYPVYPRGFVCADERTATTRLDHPKLGALPIPADLGARLPFVYARTVRDAPLFEDSGAGAAMVNRAGTVPSQSGMAIVGSLGAKDSGQGARRLALMTNGRFVDAVDLEAAEPSEFEGIELIDGIELPVAFVVKRGVRTWRLDGQRNASKHGSLRYHARLDLTGRFRTVRGIKFWALSDGRWVRHQDVTLLLPRQEFPETVTGSTRWIDVSLSTGTLLLYEGRRPTFATLVSVGSQTRSGGPEATVRGELRVRFKHVTGVGLEPSGFAQRVEIYDLPWAIELSSGQFIHGAFWHDRFGVEHGPGNIQLSPADARRVFLWTAPQTPRSWHARRMAKSVEPSK
jgi:hypothetical protein